MPTHDDEGPSEEDLRRYGVDAASAEDEVAHCPDCSAEMHASADICPRCFCFVTGARPRRNPGRERARKRRKAIIIALLLLAMALPFLAWLRWW